MTLLVSDLQSGIGSLFQGFYTSSGLGGPKSGGCDIRWQSSWKLL